MKDFNPRKFSCVEYDNNLYNSKTKKKVYFSSKKIVNAKSFFSKNNTNQLSTINNYNSRNTNNTIEKNTKTELNTQTQDSIQLNMKLDYRIFSQLNDIQNRLLESEKKNTEIYSRFAEFKINSEKINEMSNKLKENELNLVKLNCLVTNLEKDFNRNYNKYDSMFSETFLVPGFIGPSCKYKNLKDFLIFLIEKIDDYERICKEYLPKLRSFSENYQAFILQVNNRINNIQDSIFAYSHTQLNPIEKKIDDLKIDFEDKINKARLENINYTYDLRKEAQKIIKNKENINEIKDNFLSEIDDIRNQFSKLKNYFPYKSKKSRKRSISNNSMKNTSKLQTDTLPILEKSGENIENGNKNDENKKCINDADIKKENDNKKEIKIDKHDNDSSDSSSGKNKNLKNAAENDTKEKNNKNNDKLDIKIENKKSEKEKDKKIEHHDLTISEDLKKSNRKINLGNKDKNNDIKRDFLDFKNFSEFYCPKMVSLQLYNINNSSKNDRRYQIPINKKDFKNKIPMKFPNFSHNKKENHYSASYSPLSNKKKNKTKINPINITDDNFGTDTTGNENEIKTSKYSVYLASNGKKLIFKNRNYSTENININYFDSSSQKKKKDLQKKLPLIIKTINFKNSTKVNV